MSNQSEITGERTTPWEEKFLRGVGARYFEVTFQLGRPFYADLLVGRTIRGLLGWALMEVRPEEREKPLFFRAKEEGMAHHGPALVFRPLIVGEKTKELVCGITVLGANREDRQAVFENALAHLADGRLREGRKEPWILGEGGEGGQGVPIVGVRAGMPDLGTGLRWRGVQDLAIHFHAPLSWNKSAPRDPQALTAAFLYSRMLRRLEKLWEDWGSGEFPPVPGLQDWHACAAVWASARQLTRHELRTRGSNPLRISGWSGDLRLNRVPAPMARALHLCSLFNLGAHADTGAGSYSVALLES